MKITKYWVFAASSAVCIMACDRNDEAGEVTNHDAIHERSADPVLERDAAKDPMGQPAANERREHDSTMTGKAEDGVEAKASIEPGKDTKIDGEAHFTQTEAGVKIVVNVKDAPVGEKGIHIHEKGDCSDIPGKSMGGHFAPQGDRHGLPDAPRGELHLGDLGNIEIKPDGTGTKEILIKEANLKEGDSMSFLGKALVIHEGKDKGAANQPSGDSGSPIACAVIEKS